ncbi:MAG: CNNM domain-containing protein [Candidatus Saccharibacteria bacterium]
MEFLIVFIEVALLVLVSAVCSGLNIAVMALDMADLKRKAQLGNRQAKRVLPLKQKTHLTLASILLTNVAAVSATSLVLETYFGGLLAGIVSTLLIVILGEVIPQALFAKNPLMWASYLAPVLSVMIKATYVVSKPLELLLDKMIGRQPAELQSRHELGMMITEHLGHAASELDDDEVEIIRGALQLSEKRVRDIMTPVAKVYWLTPDTIITEKRLTEIKASGLSRIPIFNRSVTKCYGILLTKEMIDVDFDEQKYRVDDLPLHAVQLIGGKTALDTMFRVFINAGTHLIPVERDDNIVGIVTIEDLIEEIIGQEIEDETDRLNKHKVRFAMRR